MSTGQLAKQAGVGRVDTVRYYERDGLLSPAGRVASGYRRHGEPELTRLRFIRRARALGVSPGDIRNLRMLSEEPSVAEINRVAQTRLADVEQRINELERIGSALHTVVASCPGRSRADACRIFNALKQDEPA